MPYDVKCSSYDFDAFESIVDQNFKKLNELFSYEKEWFIVTNYTFGGFLGNLFNILLDNYKVCEKVGEDSINTIHQDILLIDEVIKDNNLVIDNINKIIENLESEVSSLTYKMNKLSPKSDEEKKQIENIKKNIENQISSLNNQINEYHLSRENIIKINNQLDDLRYNLVSREQQINNTLKMYGIYLTDLKNLYKDFSLIVETLEKEIKKIIEIINYAKSLICIVKRNLSSNEEINSPYNQIIIKDIESLAETNNKMNKFCQRLEDKIYDMNSLINTMSDMLNDETINLSKRSIKSIIENTNIQIEEIKTDSKKLYEAYKKLKEYINL